MKRLDKKKIMVRFAMLVNCIILVVSMFGTTEGYAQYRQTIGKQCLNTEKKPAKATIVDTTLSNKKTFADTTSKDLIIINLDKALEIAMSENIAVKVADKEVERAKYAKKGTYAQLYPKADIAGMYQRTIQKNVMYMDFDMSKLPGMDSGEGSATEGSDSDFGSYPGSETGGGTGPGTSTGGAVDTGETGNKLPKAPKADNGIEIGRTNTYNLGLSVAMPLINAQLWNSLKISASDVELAVEKARSSKLEMITQIKKAFYSVLFAKEALNVYIDEYENAQKNFEQTSIRFKAQKASELEYRRAESTLAATIPNIYNAESNVVLAMWQLKAVMGVDLDMNMDVDGSLDDYSENMFYEIHKHDSYTLDYNSMMKQLSIQAEQLAQAVKVQQSAYIPTIAATFSYSVNAMSNDFNFSEYRWTPHSYVGLSINIPIFSGGKRRSDVQEARVRRSQLALQTIDTERKLKIGIRQNLTAMETNMKNYIAAQKTVDTAQKAYDIVQKAFFVGRSTTTEMNDAQLVLTKARLGMSQAVFNFISAKADLEKTLGVDLREGA